MARLRRADCSGPGITRKRAGRGFAYYDDGVLVGDQEVLERIRALGIPPAWKDVWICPYPNGHLQATGIDAAGRKQYRYHEAWRTRRDAREVRRHDALRPRAAGAARAGRGRPGGDGRAHARARAGLRGAAARPRVLPHRHRGVHGDQRVLRAGHHPQGARDDRRRADDLRLPGQERSAPHPGRRRPAREGHRLHAQAPARRRAGPARLQARPPVAATCAPTTSTSTSRTSPATTSPPRTSGPGAPPCSRPSRCRSPAPRRAPRPHAKRAKTRAIKETARYLGNTPAVCRASYIDPRIFDAYDAGLVLDHQVLLDAAEPGQLPTHHPEIEAAVLDLLNEKEESPRIEKLAA